MPDAGIIGIDIGIAQYDPLLHGEEIRKLLDGPPSYVLPRSHLHGHHAGIGFQDEIDLHYSRAVLLAIISRNDTPLHKAFRNDVFSDGAVIPPDARDEIAGICGSVGMHQQPGVGKIYFELVADLVPGQRYFGLPHEVAEIPVSGLLDPQEVSCIAVGRPAGLVGVDTGEHELLVAFGQLSRYRFETFGGPDRICPGSVTVDIADATEQYLLVYTSCPGHSLIEIRPHCRRHPTDDHEPFEQAEVTFQKEPAKRFPVFQRPMQPVGFLLGYTGGP